VRTVVHFATRWIPWAILALGGLSSAWAYGPADNEAYRGRIIASEVSIAEAVGSSASVEELVQSLRRLELDAIEPCCDGAWRFHLAALLDRPAGDDVLVLSFHDKGGERRQIFSTEVPVKTNQWLVVVPDLVVTKDLGFQTGQTYTATLSRSHGAEREVLARGTFRLK
jgi:hypothetical protein